jgi:hypothetical protein
MKKLVIGCLLTASVSTANALAALSPTDYISLLYNGIKFFASGSVPKELTVTAKGTGETQSIAIENALNTAVQNAIGVLIISEQTVSGDKVVRDLVAQYSSGVVNSYEVKKCDGIPVSCEVVAKVSPLVFMRKLQGDSKTIQVNGNDLYMRHQTAKTALLQKEKITEYYMQQIRESGLEVVVKSVSVVPSTDTNVRLSINYEVKWNKQFKKEIINFLEKIERDTSQLSSRYQVYIQWAPTGFKENRVYINSFNDNYRKMLIHYIEQPTYVRYDDFGICEDIQSKNVFKIDWLGINRQTIIEVEPNRLKNLNKISMSIGGC